jgi:Na+/glutamate symporter
MGGPEILVPIAFFAMVATIVIGVPLARAHAKRLERQPTASPSPDVTARLERMEHAIESIAVEVERISEGQRFVTKLLAERAPTQLPDPSSRAR